MALGTARGQSNDPAMYRGNRLYAKGRYTEAETAYKQAFQQRKLRDAEYNLGNAQYRQKRYTDAAKAYGEVGRTSNDPTLRSMAHHNLGSTFMEEKRWDEAIDCFKKALRDRPASKESRYNLAYAQAMKKKQDEQNKQNQNKDRKEEKKNDKENKDENKNNDQNKSGGQDPQLVS